MPSSDHDRTTSFVEFVTLPGETGQYHSIDVRAPIPSLTGRLFMKRLLALTLGNLFVLGFLVFLANTLVIATFKIYKWFKPLEYYNNVYLLPNYEGAEWARIHFEELDDSLDIDYTPYSGWRHLPYDGETINIDERGLRRTFRAEGAAPERTIAFFGGSTMWGEGADDDRTIASEVIKLNPDYHGYNFGETGYVAHQSLNEFFKQYFSGFRPDIVIFYDGANEVFVHCRVELSPYSHIREDKLRSALRESASGNLDSFQLTVLPIKNFVEYVGQKLVRRMASDSLYDCDTDANEAKQVARVLLSDWLIVKNIVESYGGIFLPILQPVVYFSDTKTDHLTLNEALKSQYQAVYPLIIELMSREFPELIDNFMDLRTVLDRDEYFYIDWCHLSPNANKLVAERISQGIAARTDKVTARHDLP
jgi:hypothetical protein